VFSVPFSGTSPDIQRPFFQAAVFSPKQAPPKSALPHSYSVYENETALLVSRYTRLCLDFFDGFSPYFLTYLFVARSMVPSRSLSGCFWLPRFFTSLCKAKA
jgi:hypothetical protein